MLVTHIHGDHLDLDRLHALLESNPDARVVCDEASAAVLGERDIRVKGSESTIRRSRTRR